MAKKKKGGGMSGFRKKLKKVSTTIGTVGLFAIPAAVVGLSVKAAVDAGRWPEHAIVDHTTGYSMTAQDWKWERLVPLAAGTIGGVLWKKVWSYIGSKA